MVLRPISISHPSSHSPPSPFPPSCFLQFRGDPCISATKTKFVLVPYEDVVEYIEEVTENSVKQWGISKSRDLLKYQELILGWSLRFLSLSFRDNVQLYLK